VLGSILRWSGGISTRTALSKIGLFRLSVHDSPIGFGTGLFIELFLSRALSDFEPLLSNPLSVCEQVRLIISRPRKRAVIQTEQHADMSQAVGKLHDLSPFLYAFERPEILDVQGLYQNPRRLSAWRRCKKAVPQWETKLTETAQIRR
jgi:hypothetical protein